MLGIDHPDAPRASNSTAVKKPPRILRKSLLFCMRGISVIKLIVKELLILIRDILCPHIWEVWRMANNE
jgi:hypothetical protein